MDVLIASVVGGILCLDRVFVQAMISRPIVAAPVIGIALGDPFTGLVAGAFIELFWIDRLPIGGYIPPNDTIAAVLTAAAAIETGNILGRLPEGLIALAILLYVPLALAMQKMELGLVQGNEERARAAAGDAARGDIRSIARNHLFAALLAWFLPAAVILIALPLGVAAMAWAYPRLAPWIVRGLDLLYGLLPLIGVAVAFNTVDLRRALPIFCAVFLIATVILQYFRQ